MSAWFTSDLHLGHVNILAYTDRPFADVDAMNAGLVARWNEVVEPSDVVWVLGDVALGRIDETLPMVGQLHGHKRLVTGNHDRCWSGHGSRADGWTQRYLDGGFDEIHQGQVEIDLGERTVVASHFPYRGDSQDEDRFVEQRPVDSGAWLLHGHVHDRWRQHGRMINVGVDAWDERPVAASTLEALIDAGVHDLAPLPTTR